MMPSNISEYSQWLLVGQNIYYLGEFQSKIEESEDKRPVTGNYRTPSNTNHRPLRATGEGSQLFCLSEKSHRCLHIGFQRW